MKNHIIWLLMTLISITLFFSNAMATKIVASGTCGAEGDNLTWELDEEGTLTISGTGEMKSWYLDVNYSAPWESNKPSINKVIIRNGVTSIGSCAFSWCTGLTSITIPSSVNSIGSHAFNACQQIKRINIDSIESWINIEYGDNALSHPNCYPSDYHLYINDKECTAIIIPDTVTRIGSYAFTYFSSIISITIPESVTVINSNAFFECNKISNIQYSGPIDLAKKIKIDFNNSILMNTTWVCNDGNILLRKLPYEGTTSNGLVWKYTPEGQLSISGNGAINEHPWDFLNGSIQTVSIENGITSIGDEAFYNCSEITSIIIPNSVINIGHDAFNNCKSLISITIPSSVISIGTWAFYKCNRLRDIHIDSIESWLNIDYGNDEGSHPNYAASNCRLYIGNQELSSISVPNNVNRICEWAFYNCSNLISITIPNNVTSIGHHAFSNCAGLISATISNSVTSISEGTFSNCSSLTNINMGNSITSIGDWAFYNCPRLTSITIPPNITYIGKSCFYYTLKKLYMPGTNEIMIDDTAFKYTSPTVYCYEYTPNEGWARSMGFPVVLLDNTSPQDYISLTIPEATSVGLGMRKQIDTDIFPLLSEYETMWFSSNPSIVSVDSKGMLTGVSIGSTIVTLSYGELQASCQVTVLQPEEYITIILPETATVGIGKQTHLESSISPLVEELEQEWTSSDPNVVTVSMDGTLTGSSAGTANVTLSYGGVQAVCHVTVDQYAESFSLSELWLVAKTGIDAGSLVTDIEPADSVVQFIWSTENSIYATVDTNGYITAGAVGETTLTVTDKLSGLRRTAAVHSCYPVTAIDLTLSEKTVYLGTSVQATASVTMRTQYCENHLVTFSSGNPSIAEIDQQGNIQTFRPGTVTITATAVNNESISASATLSVTKDFQCILRLPVNLTEIGSEAFAGLPAAEAVRIPESVTSIADDAFSGSSIIIISPDGSYAITWAQDHGFDYLIE